MAIYKSDITRFIDELRQRNPYLEDEQRRGRAIWWDRDPIDLDEMHRARESSAARQPSRHRTTR